MKQRKKEVAPEARVEGDALVIGCSACKYAPEPSSSECMSCIVRLMSESGCTDRVILRTGKDMEISGKSGNALKRMASLRRWSIPVKEKDMKCKRCDMSRSAVMGRVWNAFPDMNIDGTESSLESRTDPECSRCIASSKAALEQLKTDLDVIRTDLLVQPW